MIRLLHWRKADTDRDIDAVTDGINPATGALEMNRDTRIGRHETGDHVSNLKIELCDRSRCCCRSKIWSQFLLPSHLRMIFFGWVARKVT